jgi:hypothetical protein
MSDVQDLSSPPLGLERLELAVAHGAEEALAQVRAGPLDDLESDHAVPPVSKGRCQPVTTGEKYAPVGDGDREQADGAGSPTVGSRPRLAGSRRLMIEAGRRFERPTRSGSPLGGR